MDAQRNVEIKKRKPATMNDNSTRIVSRTHTAIWINSQKCYISGKGKAGIKGYTAVLHSTGKAPSLQQD